MPYNYSCTFLGPHTSAAHCAICQNSDSDTIIKSSWRAGSEPQIIYSLFFSPGAVSQWTTYMNNWSPSLVYLSVFVHQRPYCDFNDYSAPSPVSPLSGPGTYKCEIGDLLVVFSDYPASRRVAALFQAKMSGGPWPPKNPDQWELYTHWPTFGYTATSPSSSSGRQFRTLPFSGSADSSAQYLILDSSKTSSEITLPLSSPLYSAWGQTVNRALNGGAGRDFSWDRASAVNDWDYLIWDLLDYTRMWAAPASVAGTGGGTRGAGSLLEVHSSHDVTGGNGPGERVVTSDDGWGIPIIHIIRNSQQSERQK